MVLHAQTKPIIIGTTQQKLGLYSCHMYISNKAKTEGQCLTDTQASYRSWSNRTLIMAAIPF